MEIIIIAGVVILAGWYIFFRQPKKSVSDPVVTAPYKVEAEPAPVVEAKVEAPKVEETAVPETKVEAQPKKRAAKPKAPAAPKAEKKAPAKTAKAKSTPRRVK